MTYINKENAACCAIAQRAFFYPYAERSNNKKLTTICKIPHNSALQPRKPKHCILQRVVGYN